jgi:hypothetical protein
VSDQLRKDQYVNSIESSVHHSANAHHTVRHHP